MPEPGDFIGTGFDWPLRVNQSGAISTTSRRDGLDGALIMILSTAPGERVMRPEFGCKIWNLLFEPINANTLGLMAEAVREALGRWEPRVDLIDVRVVPDQDRHGQVAINIDYAIKTTNDKRNLVYPFYVIPREVKS